MDLNQSSVAGLQLRRDVASGKLKLNGPDQARVTLTLEDGTQYPMNGTLQFTDITVDPGTGSVTVRAIFPNPQHVLLPGMFVHARIDEGVNDAALLVPEVGVTHDPKGQAIVLVVGTDNKVALRTIQATRTAGDQWVVDGGLNEGERVIVAGLQKVQPGMLVNAVESPARATPVPALERPFPTARRQHSTRTETAASRPNREERVSKFFIDRPIFAIVIAILIMLAGGLSILTLPIEQYPQIAPPSVQISTTYPGASHHRPEHGGTGDRATDERARSLLHLASVSDDTGQSTTTLTFAAGTDPNIAQVQVQNKLQLATPLLPAAVQQSGIRVTKSSSSFLLVAGFVSTDNSMSKFDIANYIVSNIQDPISRIDGVGNFNVFGTQYAIRIWLDPHKLNSYALTPLDVTTAVTNQNVQISGGQLGGTPAVANQQLTATITEATLLRTPENLAPSC